MTTHSSILAWIIPHVSAFLDSQFYSFDLSVFNRGPPSLDNCSYVYISFEIRKCESSNFVPLFHDSFDCSGSLAFPYAFLGSVNFCKSKRERERTLGVLIESC